MLSDVEGQVRYKTSTEGEGELHGADLGDLGPGRMRSPGKPRAGVTTCRHSLAQHMEMGNFGGINK